MAKKNTKPAKKKSYEKLTASLREQIRIEFVQGELDPQGFRRTNTIDQLAKDHNVSINTLYKSAQKENWRQQQELFQKEYLAKLDATRMKEFVEESKKFDLTCLNMSKALLARVGQVIRDAQGKDYNAFTPQQLDSLSGAALKIQKFARLALGEATENMNLNANIQDTDAFRNVMELLDSVAEQRRESDGSSVH
tara:strand:+ start:3140 stop:3721 length:582 start_codon:yes stop_codon:yes gene_type:complete